MKKFLLLFFSLIILNSTYADGVTLSGGVSVDDVPEALFGSWQVTAKLDNTNSYGTFKPVSADMWYLSRFGDTITLSNPITGAKAEISVKAVEGNLVVFSKKAPYDNKILTDTVTIRLDKNSFTGINDLFLDTYSNVDNHLMKSEKAKYIIKGTKVSGDSVLK